MSKTVISYNGTTLGSYSTNANPNAAAPVPVFTAAANADGSVPKDPRK